MLQPEKDCPTPDLQSLLGGDEHKDDSAAYGKMSNLHEPAVSNRNKKKKEKKKEKKEMKTMDSNLINPFTGKAFTTPGVPFNFNFPSNSAQVPISLPKEVSISLPKEVSEKDQVIESFGIVIGQ